MVEKATAWPQPQPQRTISLPKPQPQRSLPTDRCNNKMEQSEVIGELQKSMSATGSTDSGSEDSPINVIEINHEAYHSWDDSTIDVSIMIGTTTVPAATVGSLRELNGSTIVEENNDGDTSKAPKEAETSWNVLQNKVRSWNERASKEPTEEEADRSLLFAPTFQDFVDGIAVSTIRSTQMGVESIKNLLLK